MRTVINGKNMTVSDQLRSRLDKKLGHLAHYFNRDASAQVVMSVEKNRHILEITIPYEGIVLRAQAVSDDMYVSIDEAVERLEKQIVRQRTRLSKKLHEDAFVFEEEEEAVEEEFVPKLVKTKRFAVKPMDVEEAIMQMDLVGHDFFVFANAETGEVNVLYKRLDGNYGLIEPDYDSEDDE